jgi:tungstate transport system ATP-binding protein
MFLLEKLHQKYGEKEVLKGINLRVERGEVLALIGPTGAGKTTFLRILDLLDIPAAGKIYFAGQDVTRSKRLRLETRRRMALVFQKPVAFKASVYDNVAYALKVRGHNGRDISARVNSMLDTVDLADYRNRNALSLSGGEAQRVALARAMITQPEVLLLDEPTANLDPISTSTIENLIKRFNREYETTIIMATHDMAQGQRLAHRIGVLMNGELMQIGKPGEIFSRPANMKVAEFVGVENILKGTVSSNEGGVVSVDVDGKTIEGISDYHAGEEVSVCIRPEDVTLVLSKTSSSARNSFPAEIKLIVSSGPLVRVELDCGFPLMALLTRRSAEEMGLEVGKDVYASFKATAVHIIRESRVWSLESPAPPPLSDICSLT